MDKAMSTRPDAVSDASSYVRWPTIIAGAVAGAAVAFVLMAFAAAIGLAVASPSPTWRDASAWLALLSGVWVLLVQVFSFALAGYIAGRMRTKLAGFDANEVEFRDGMHGLLAWAVGVIIGFFVIFGRGKRILNNSHRRQRHCGSFGKRQVAGLPCVRIGSLVPE